MALTRHETEAATEVRIRSTHYRSLIIPASVSTGIRSAVARREGESVQSERTPSSGGESRRLPRVRNTRHTRQAVGELRRRGTILDVTRAPAEQRPCVN
jgi:hypothetical protein